MLDDQKSHYLKNDFVMAHDGDHFNLDRKIGDILDDMVIGYVEALGSDRNLGTIVELNRLAHPVSIDAQISKAPA